MFWRLRRRRFRRRAGCFGLLLAALIMIGLFALARRAFAQDDMPGMDHSDHTESTNPSDHANHLGMVMGSCDGLPITDADQAYADRFAERAAAAAVRFVDFDAAVSEGYRQSTPFGVNGKGPAHFLNVAYALDSAYLDPERPESLIYMPLGSRKILMGVMFVAPRGAAPCPAGGLLVWHAHDGVCYNDGGLIVNVVGADGACAAGQVKRDTQEMLHVWTFDNPDGTYATGLTLPAIYAAAAQCLQGNPICA
jgi:hypothetical protein